MEAMVGASLLSGTAGASTVGLLGAGGVLAPAAGTLFSGGVGSLLSGLLTGASAFSQVQAGNLNAQILNIQARQSDLNARQETVKGRQKALAIKDNLERTLAGQNATFEARGVLQGEGSALAAEQASRDNASKDIDSAMFDAQFASESEKLQGTQFRSEAKSSKSAGYTRAAETLAGSRTIRNLGTSLLEGI